MTRGRRRVDKMGLFRNGGCLQKVILNDEGEWGFQKCAFAWQGGRVGLDPSPKRIHHLWTAFSKVVLCREKKIFIVDPSYLYLLHTMTTCKVFTGHICRRPDVQSNLMMDIIPPIICSLYIKLDNRSYKHITPVDLFRPSKQLSVTLGILFLYSRLLMVLCPFT